MKTIKFISYFAFMLFLGISLSSCKGEDGADGAPGPAGADGNANVQTYIYNNPTWNGSFINIEMSGILTADVIKNDVVLGYVNFGNDTYAIPGIVWKNSVNKQFKVFMQSSNETYAIASHELDGSYTPPANVFEVAFVKIIIIESTNTTTNTGNGKMINSKQAIYNELQAAGVDVNDYYQVCAYYGIDPK
jgi:hypothetical protein